MNTPNLYITFFKNSEGVTIGPYFSASFDGFDVADQEFVCYQVMDKNAMSRRITVPRYATLRAVIYDYKT